LLVCTFLRGVFLVFEHQKPSPMRGRWHGAAVTDEVEARPITQLHHLISRLRRQLPLVGEAFGVYVLQA